MDVESLSRLQFAFTAMFHYIFPPFSIGMGLLLVIYESLFLITKKKIYETITRFWIKIFAANFSVGVATGIVLEFEFGTNWATYSRFVGDVFGSPLAAEGIFAFFLESGFLAVLLFGWDKVKPGVHLFATIMVALGSIMSGFWIIVANSWQQTPVAYELVQDAGGFTRAAITDFWAMVFNPSTASRFTHTILGAFIQGAFLILSVSAYYFIKGVHLEFARKSFVIALIVATITSLAQPIAGHYSAHVAYEYQPAKMAAFEGLYETQKNAPLYLIGITDEESKETKGIKIPGALSYLLGWRTDFEVKGLDQFDARDHPPVNAVFQSYHIMIVLGSFFVGLTLLSLFLLWRGKLFSQKWLLKIYVASVVLPVIANQAGWYSAERGRQPWLVYGLLRTEDGVSKSIVASEVLTSLILFGIIYLLLFFAWIYILDKEIKHGPGSLKQLETNYPDRQERIDIITRKQKD
ncbi:cytochrome ubiquinol oxidase subunit I [Fulvivirgaceae bacterium BMA12]|uniref:Cytochrome ubiquinol oxidase subunit I n=1 Tax=Agaribacillus aureus TaxID=3051825 RepID=A0ABT8L0C7_9BACT|nr:cytochrome ubiquinol oxidase subunit I [Fulvivirgaceae bacterium BMA12]